MTFGAIRNFLAVFLVGLLDFCLTPGIVGSAMCFLLSFPFNLAAASGDPQDLDLVPI